MKTKTNHCSRRVMAMLLVVVTILSIFSGTVLAAQENHYHDPAEHWMTSSNRTTELDVNAVVTHETFYCPQCDMNTSLAYSGVHARRPDGHAPQREILRRNASRR